MKYVFITTVSHQPTLHAVLYESNDPDLTGTTKTAYPIFNLMHAIVAKLHDGNTTDEEKPVFELIAILYPSERARQNLALLETAVDEFSFATRVNVQFTLIHQGLEETSREHLNLFLALVKAIPERCNLYVDITYGTKPTPVTLFAVLLYLKNLRSLCAVRRIVYGQIESWQPDAATQSNIPTKATLYDISKLFSIVSVAEKMAQFGGENLDEAMLELVIAATQ